MTKAELITDLESKPDVLHIVDSNPAVVNTVGAVNWYDIPIIRSLGDNYAQGAVQPVIVIDEGTVDEVAFYNGKKNFTEPQRANLYTDQQYIDGLEAEFPGWKVLNLSVRIDPGANTDTDILTVKAFNPTDDLYVTEQIAVWNDPQGDYQLKFVE